jgi:hypothetical protein
VSTKALPKIVSSGSKIYCDSKTAAGTVANASLTLTLNARSTVNIQVVWSFASSLYACSFSVDGADFSVPTRGSTTMKTTAITRDAGTYTINAGSTPITGSHPAGRVMIVAIVGANTGDDCLVEPCVPTAYVEFIRAGAVTMPLPAGDPGDMLYAIVISTDDVAATAPGWTTYGNSHNTAFGSTPVVRRFFRIREAGDTDFTPSGYGDEGVAQVFNIPHGNAVDLIDSGKFLGYNGDTENFVLINPGSYGQNIVVLSVWTTGGAVTLTSNGTVLDTGTDDFGEGIAMTTFYLKTTSTVEYDFSVSTGSILGHFWHGFRTCDAELFENLHLTAGGGILATTSYVKIPWAGSSAGFTSVDSGLTWDGASPHGYAFSATIRWSDSFVATGGTRYARVTALPSGTQYEVTAGHVNGINTSVVVSGTAPVGTTGFFVEEKSTVGALTVLTTSTFDVTP